MNKQIKRKRFFAPNFKDRDDAVIELLTGSWKNMFFFNSYYCLRNFMAQNFDTSKSKYLDLCEKLFQVRWTHDIRVFQLIEKIIIELICCFNKGNTDFRGHWVKELFISIKQVLLVHIKIITDYSNHDILDPDEYFPGYTKLMDDLDIFGNKFNITLHQIYINEAEIELFKELFELARRVYIFSI